MFRGKVFLLTVSVIPLLLCTLPAYSQVIEGPVLNVPEGGWTDFGLIIRAEADVVLVSVRFPNSGSADTIELLRDSDGALLASIPTAAGEPDALVNINYALTASETYRLVATNPYNRFYGYIQTPVGDDDITVLYSYSYSSASGSWCLWNGIWAAFNDITTEPNSTPETAQVVIDIKPGNYPNSINLRSRGLVPVAILSTEDFDASSVNPDSIELAGAFATRWIIRDVDGDGNSDMLLHFATQELTGLSYDSTEATLTGSTFDGTQFEGTDSVNIVPRNK